MQSQTLAHTNATYNSNFALPTLNLVPCLYILVSLTIILTFISQMHVKGSQRIRFRWWRKTQRAANEIWTTTLRLRDLREQSVVRCTHQIHAE